ncbi:MAG: hypothetical protein AAF696_02470 [Bacteroidota bacterium]
MSEWRRLDINQSLEQLGGNVSPELEARFSIFKPIKLTKGEYFLRKGEICKKMVFLTQGQVRHFYDVDAKEVTRWISLDQNFLTSFASFVSGRPIPSNIS